MNHGLDLYFHYLEKIFEGGTQDLPRGGNHPEKWKNKPDLSRFQGSRGNIVNTSSTAGLGAMPEFVPYCASKWAVLGMTQSIAKEYAKDGIRINAVCPATTDTPMRSRFKEQWPEWQSQTDGCYPVGRVATPEEIAAANDDVLDFLNQAS